MIRCTVADYQRRFAEKRAELEDLRLRAADTENKINELDRAIQVADVFARNGFFLNAYRRLGEQ